MSIESREDLAHAVAELQKRVRHLEDIDALRNLKGRVRRCLRRQL